MAPRILVDVTHPAHVHFFRPAIRIWQERGVDVRVVARDKDVTLELLDHYGLEYQVLSKTKKGILGLAFELCQHEWHLFRIIKSWKPDVVLEVAGTFIVHAAFLTRTPSLVFYDTEHARISNAITYPFATKIITPMSYKGDLGKKHIRYDGYQELAYLHPKYFEPDPSVRDELGLSDGERYAIIRFVSWGAGHDRGQSGISLEFARKLIAKLEEDGRVFISSEGPLPIEFEPYRLRLPAHRMHDALAFATVYIGEGATMASEAAILGTRAVYTNSLSLGYIEEQAVVYGLVRHCMGEVEIVKAIEGFSNGDQQNADLDSRRERMLGEKIDVSRFIIEQVQKYTL